MGDENPGGSDHGEQRASLAVEMRYTRRDLDQIAKDLAVAKERIQQLRTDLAVVKSRITLYATVGAGAVTAAINVLMRYLP